MIFKSLVVLALSFFQLTAKDQGWQTVEKSLSGKESVIKNEEDLPTQFSVGFDRYLLNISCPSTPTYSYVNKDQVQVFVEKEGLIFNVYYRSGPQEVQQGQRQVGPFIIEGIEGERGAIDEVLSSIELIEKGSSPS